MDDADFGGLQFPPGYLPAATGDGRGPGLELMPIRLARYAGILEADAQRLAKFSFKLNAFVDHRGIAGNTGQRVAQNSGGSGDVIQKARAPEVHTEGDVEAKKPVIKGLRQ